MAYTQYNPYLPYMGMQQNAQIPQYGYQPQYQPQYQQTVPALNGRFVGNVDEISANDVSMSGDTSFFPLRDSSAILAKSWSADGTIKTTIYKPVVETAPEPTPTISYTDMFSEISKKIDGIYDQLDKLPKRSVKKSEPLTDDE